MVSSRVRIRAGVAVVAAMLVAGSTVAASTAAGSAYGDGGDRRIVHKKAIALSAGPYSNCVVTAKHAAKCWGWNGYGQLGNNTTTDSRTPVSVYGLRSGVKAISVGDHFTCALTMKGAVKCWGSNATGQLGRDGIAQSDVPVQVVGLTTGVRAITAGQGFACALTAAGRAKCWGFNGYGQLGDNTTTQRWTPVAVYNLGRGVKAISAGAYHTCAVNSASKLKCWGSNAYGELGDGTTTDSPQPVGVKGLGKVSQVSAGVQRTCATKRHTAWCWGSNSEGVLGDGTTSNSSAPVQVSGLAGRTIVVRAGLGLHSCAVTTKRRAKCWGYNPLGELGNNSSANSSVPVSVLNLRHVAGISVGAYHSCARTRSGAVYCWGANVGGQLGNGTTTSASVPVRVTGF